MALDTPPSLSTIKILFDMEISGRGYRCPWGPSNQWPGFVGLRALPERSRLDVQRGDGGRPPGGSALPGGDHPADVLLLQVRDELVDDLPAPPDGHVVAAVLLQLHGREGGRVDAPL